MCPLQLIVKQHFTHFKQAGDLWLTLAQRNGTVFRRPSEMTGSVPGSQTDVLAITMRTVMFLIDV